MIALTVKFEDFNGDEHEGTFHFHISEMDLLDQVATSEGSWADFVDRMTSESDIKNLHNMIEFFVNKSYGIKSEDGLSFEKSEEITRRFRSHPAYSKLVMELLEKDGALADFTNKVFPRDVQKKHELTKAQITKRLGKSEEDISAKEFLQAAEEMQREELEKQKTQANQ